MYMSRVSPRIFRFQPLRSDRLNLRRFEITDEPMATEMPTVIGTPIEFGAGLKVMPPNMTGADAVPLIDGQTAGILQAINSFTIKQRVSIYVESTACVAGERLVGRRRPTRQPMQELALIEASGESVVCGAGRRLSRS